MPARSQPTEIQRHLIRGVSMSSPFTQAVRRRALQTTSPGVLAAVLAAAALAPTAVAAQGSPPENEPLELGPLRVEDQNQMPLQQESGIARLPGTVQDTPQTINVITSQVLQQQAVTTLDQALRNVAGVTLGVGEGGGSFSGDQFRIRGFDAKDDIYIDGLRDFGVY